MESRMLARTDSRGRALFLLVVMALIATVVGGRLAWWHVVQHDRLAAMAANQMAQREEIPAERGEIRDDHGVLLATSIQVFSVYATPPQVTDPESEASILSIVLSVPDTDLLDLFTSGKAWVWLERRVDPKVSDRVRALGLPGIGLLPETRRVYPDRRRGPRIDTGIAGARIRQRGRVGAVRRRGRRERAACRDVGHGRRAGGRRRSPDRRLDHLGPGAGQRR